MADIRFKSKQQVSTILGTEAVPAQCADGIDRWMTVTQLAAHIRNGMLAQSGTGSVLYGTGSTPGQQALLPYSQASAGNSIARRNNDGSLCAATPLDPNTAPGDTLVNMDWLNTTIGNESEYNQSAFVARTGAAEIVYGTNADGEPVYYPLADLAGGGGGGGVTPTTDPDKIYGTDNTGEAKFYAASLSVPGAPDTTIPLRGPDGELRAGTPEDFFGQPTDVVNRSFLDRARTDRFVSGDTADETDEFVILDGVDGLILSGPDVPNFNIVLPPLESNNYAKNLTIRFLADITSLTWESTPWTMEFTKTSAKSGDVVNLGYDSMTGAWYIKSDWSMPAAVDTTDYWQPSDLGGSAPQILVDADDIQLPDALTLATNGSRQITAAASRFNAATYPQAGNGDCIYNRRDHRFNNFRSITCAGGTGIMQSTGTAANALSANKAAFTFGGFFAYLVDTGSSGTQVPFIYVGSPTADSLRLSIGRASNELNGLRYGSRRLDGETAQSYDAVGNMGTTPFFAWMRVNWVTGVTELWVNGALVHTGTTPTSGGNSANTNAAFMGIGASSSSGSNQCPIATRMYMFEPSWVPDATLRRLEGYYAHQIGMADILVSGHTYRNARPVA